MRERGGGFAVGGGGDGGGGGGGVGGCCYLICVEADFSTCRCNKARRVKRGRGPRKLISHRCFLCL